MYTRNCIESSNLSFTAKFETTKPLKTLKFSGVLCFLGGQKGLYGNIHGKTGCWIARVRPLVYGASSPLGDDEPRIYCSAPKIWLGPRQVPFAWLQPVRISTTVFAHINVAVCVEVDMGSWPFGGDADAVPAAFLAMP